MNDKTKQLLENGGGKAFDAVQKLFLVQDIRVAERRGEKLGMLLYRLDRKHRERTLSNLALAFPEWDQKRRDHVAKEVFLHWGRVAADFFRSPIRTNEEVIASMKIRDTDFLEIADSCTNGVLSCTAHFGNFERFGHWATAQGRTITVVARDANQGAIQKRIDAIRAHSGMTYLPRGNSARGIIGVLRRGGVVGILPDQNDDECFVPFFGKPAGTVLGPAVLHLRTKATLVSSFCARIGPGQYETIVMPPINSVGLESDPPAIMSLVNADLEKVVREFPEQYLWMHDRWKNARRRGLL